MTQLEATPYGYQAQVDFGERRVPVAGSNGHKRIYFMAMVLSRSRYKFVFMSDTPFTTEKSVYAHELAFKFFGGVPETILYDQDKCFLYKEYYGDNQLTYKFKRFVDDIGFRPDAFRLEHWQRIRQTTFTNSHIYQKSFRSYSL